MLSSSALTFSFKCAIEVFVTCSPIMVSIIHCTEIKVQFQQSNSTEAREDKDPRIFLRIQVIITSTAILGTDVTLNFSVVDGNATGKVRGSVCNSFHDMFL